MAAPFFGTAEALGFGDESARGEMNELLSLLEQKDRDLMRAAELGKMLLDEKEADAEAHEGEKEALWRRIQDMARRVMELEQEAAGRDKLLSHYQNENLQAAGGNGTHRRGSVGGGGVERAEERALRAKNEMLERQLEHLREDAEEARLELAAANKARFHRRPSRPHARGGGSISQLGSPTPSSLLGLGEGSLSEAFSAAAFSPLSPADSSPAGKLSAAAAAAAAAGIGAGDAFVTPGHNRNHRRLSSRTPSTLPLRSSVSSPPMWEASGEGGGGDVNEGGGDGSRGHDGVGVADDGAVSEASNHELRSAYQVHAAALRARTESGHDTAGGGMMEGGAGGGVEDDGEVGDEHDTAWLLEQNKWLMDELESKDELVEALREQITELQQELQQQWGVQGRQVPSAVPSLRDLGQGDNSDDSDDCDGDGGERSFLDHLLHASAGGGVTQGTSPPVPQTGGRLWEDGDRGAPKLAAAADADAGAAAGASKDSAAVGGCNEPTADGSLVRLGQPYSGAAPGERTRRSFGGTLAENARHEDPEADSDDRGRRAQHFTNSMKNKIKGGNTGACSTTPQSKSPLRGAAGGGDRWNRECENSPSRSKGNEAHGGETRQQQKQEEQAPVSSVSVVSSATPASAVTRPASAVAPPAAPAAAAAAPAVEAMSQPAAPVSQTTVSDRKRAVAAAKARNKEEQATAAEAEADAKQREWASPTRSPDMCRAERKSRQAVEKLGLRTVKGVFRVTMTTSNGVVFVVKSPDVFRHPQQDTYVVFGTADTDRSGAEVRHPSRSKLVAPVDATRVCPNAKATSNMAAPPPSARPDPSAVESESVAAGLDPADVLTIVSHAGCSPGEAIDALRETGGDVVNAVMSLTDATVAA